MIKEPIFLEPVFQERVWGGKKLQQEFGYAIPSDTTGEAWVVSAHPNGASKVRNGSHKGETLDQLWEKNGELFNKSANDGDYPLLVKILDASNDLSVQVHPGDKYAQEVEGAPYGKTECWYVLDAEKGARLTVGHNADSQKTFDQMADNGEWEALFRDKEVSKGDFIYVPSGTIHAIGRGITILEVQQSSDITYRVYDYDRKDLEGNLRDLHLEQAKDVVNIPHEDALIDNTVTDLDGLKIEKLVQERYFTVEKWQVDGETLYQNTEDFLQVNVIDGGGVLEVNGREYEIEKGENFILPSAVTEVGVNGKMEMIVSYP